MDCGSQGKRRNCQFWKMRLLRDLSTSCTACGARNVWCCAHGTCESSTHTILPHIPPAWIVHMNADITGPLSPPSVPVAMQLIRDIFIESQNTFTWAILDDYTRSSLNLLCLALRRIEHHLRSVMTHEDVLHRIDDIAIEGLAQIQDGTVAFLRGLCIDLQAVCMLFKNPNIVSSDISVQEKQNEIEGYAHGLDRYCEILKAVAEAGKEYVDTFSIHVFKSLICSLENACRQNSSFIMRNLQPLYPVWLTSTDLRKMNSLVCCLLTFDRYIANISNDYSST
jgi:hypothetical protein